MKLVDTMVCVGCGVVEHRLAVGKSARQFNGVCDKCQPSLFPEVGSHASSSNGSKNESQGVSARKSS